MAPTTKTIVKSTKSSGASNFGSSKAIGIELTPYNVLMTSVVFVVGVVVMHLLHRLF